MLIVAACVRVRYLVFDAMEEMKIDTQQSRNRHGFQGGPNREFESHLYKPEQLCAFFNGRQGLRWAVVGHHAATGGRHL